MIKKIIHFLERFEEERAAEINFEQEHIEDEYNHDFDPELIKLANATVQITEHFAQGANEEELRILGNDVETHSAVTLARGALSSALMKILNHNFKLSWMMMKYHVWDALTGVVGCTLLFLLRRFFCKKNFFALLFCIFSFFIASFCFLFCMFPFLLCSSQYILFLE